MEIAVCWFPLEIYSIFHVSLSYSVSQSLPKLQFPRKVVKTLDVRNSDTDAHNHLNGAK